MSSDLPTFTSRDRGEGDKALHVQLDLLFTGSRKLGVKGVRALLPKPLVLEMTSPDSNWASAMIFACAEGYETIWVWDVDSSFRDQRPRGLNPSMRFAAGAIECFFQALATAIAEHDAEGREDNNVRERRRALEVYREMLSGS